MKLVLVALLLSLALGTVYFKEEFLDESWNERWVVSGWNKDNQGEWKWTHGKWYGDALQDKGIQTGEDYRFYAISARFDDFSNEGKDLVFQFNHKFEQSIDCGGGYIKLLPPGFDQENFGGDTPYEIMFGPDVCGSTRKTHLIFNYKGKNLEKKSQIRVETDRTTHTYTLVLHPDKTFEVYIDGAEASKGELESEWDFLAPATIKDPEAKKPEDWIDEAKIADPEDQKPENWDDIAEFIPDPEASKPEDWDDETDGDWEAPLVENPEYKGEWQPRMIENPDYKGPWVHPTIANPDYVADDLLYQHNFGGVGIELWQVKSGTFFDSIIVTDSKEEADALLEIRNNGKEGEKTMKDQVLEAEGASDDGGDEPEDEDELDDDLEMGEIDDTDEGQQEEAYDLEEKEDL